jgi:hypothetical protein
MVRRLRAALLLAAIAQASCAEDYEPAQPAPRTVFAPTPEDPSDPEPVFCDEGAICNCDDGRMGEISCDQETAVCECDHCPQFTAPAPAPAFDACGGEPFGEWALETLSLPVYEGFGEQCPGLAYDLQDSFFYLNLEDGGGLVFVKDPIDFSVDVLESCIDPSLVSCGSRDNCTNICGICRCDFHDDPMPVPRGWTRTDSSLSFRDRDISPNTYLSYDYCVVGNVMQLKDANGVVYTLRHVRLSSAPHACAGRTEAQCVAGCAMGECAGTGDCAGVREESACTNRQNCTWDAQKCSGTPAACEPRDVGVVPGCLFVTLN